MNPTLKSLELLKGIISVIKVVIYVAAVCVVHMRQRRVGLK